MRLSRIEIARSQRLRSRMQLVEELVSRRRCVSKFIRRVLLKRVGEILQQVRVVRAIGTKRGRERIVEGRDGFARRRLNRCVHRAAVAQLRKNPRDCIGPVRLRDVLNDLRRVEVAEQHLAGKLRTRESAVDILQRMQPVPIQRGKQFELHLAPPLRMRQPLLVHRQPLGKPARHVIARRADRHRMRELVPERPRPVVFVARLRARGVDRNHVAETHAEQPEVRHAGDPHREVVAVVVGFDRNFARRSIRIPCRHRGVRGFRFADDLRSEHIGFVPMDQQREMRTLDRREIIVLIQQRDRVSGKQIEAVAVEAPLEITLGALAIAHPQKTRAENCECLRIGGGCLDGLSADRHRIRIAEPQRKVLGDRHIEPRCDRCDLLRAHLGPAKGGGVARQILRGREVGERIERSGVDRKRRVQRGLRLVVLSIENPHRSLDRKCCCVPRISGKRLVGVVLLRGEALRRQGEADVRIREVGVDGKRVFVRAIRVGVVVLVAEEIRPPDEVLRVRRIELVGRVERVVGVTEFADERGGSAGDGECLGGLEVALLVGGRDGAEDPLGLAALAGGVQHFGEVERVAPVVALRTCSAPVRGVGRGKLPRLLQEASAHVQGERISGRAGEHRFGGAPSRLVVAGREERVEIADGRNTRRVRIRADVRLEHRPGGRVVARLQRVQRRIESAVLRTPGCGRGEEQEDCDDLERAVAHGRIQR